MLRKFTHLEELEERGLIPVTKEDEKAIKLNLTLLEKEYLIKLIKEDQKSNKPLSNEFCVNTSALLQYLGYWP